MGDGLDYACKFAVCACTSAPTTPASSSRSTSVGWLRDQGHEPVDHGPFVYDAARRLPGVLPPRRRGGGGRPAGGSLGVVIGGSGNGEQIAANKVRGVRCALAWSDETAGLAREHNDANVVSVGGRMHPLDEMTRFVGIFLATVHREERHVRRIGDAGRLRDDRRAAAAARVRARPTMPEGHTLRRLATSLREAFAGRTVRVSSPQGRFAEAALLDGTRLLGADSPASTCSSSSTASGSCTSTSACIGTFLVLESPEPVPAPVGQVRLRLVGGSSYADLRGATACELVTPGAARRDPGAARARPAATRTPTPSAPGTGSDAAVARSATC